MGRESVRGLDADSEHDKARGAEEISKTVLFVASLVYML